MRCFLSIWLLCIITVVISYTLHAGRFVGPVQDESCTGHLEFLHSVWSGFKLLTETRSTLREPKHPKHLDMLMEHKINDWKLPSDSFTADSSD